MSSSYRKTVEKLNEQAEDRDRSPCRRCDDLTARVTLANYGAMCFPCYEAYCREGLSGGPKGFLDGRVDTPQQAEMRKRLRAVTPANVLSQRDSGFDPDVIAAAKNETARRVAAYMAVNRAKDGQSVSLDAINAELRMSGDLR